MSRPTSPDAPLSSSHAWTTDDALSFLPVRNEARLSDDGYCDLLHGKALIPGPEFEDLETGDYADVLTRERLDRYRELFQILDPLDTLSDGAKPALSSSVSNEVQQVHHDGDDKGPSRQYSEGSRSTCSDRNLEEAKRAVLKLNGCIDKCIAKLREHERQLPKQMSVMKASHMILLVRSYERMAKFIIELKGMVRRCYAGEQLSEKTFKTLFINFAWIFHMIFRSDTGAARPLIVRGVSIPTTPDLIYENLTSPSEFPMKQVTVVTVGEVKREPYILGTQAGQDNPRNHPVEDSTPFPDGLKGQHACHLVAGLPRTSMPNKNCIIGLVMQSTKVRLTCLNMDEDHRLQLERPDFQPEGSDACMYYTRAYDILNKLDRNHLIYIMATLASRSRESNDTCFVQI